MGKYYKAEDVINTLADQYMFEATMDSPYASNDINDYLENAKLLLADLPTIEVVFCEECKYAPYCEQYLVKTTFGDEIADGREVDFCQHGERKNDE